MENYTLTITAVGSFEDIVGRVKKELADEGFGILSDIDVRATLTNKIGKAYGAYRILGACHPESAYQAIGKEIEIGVMLPCNFIIYEETGKVHLAAVRPTVTMLSVGNDALLPLAEEIEGRLDVVIRNVASYS